MGRNSLHRHKEGGRPCRNQSGVTLVEALVTVIIFTVILGACYMLLISGTDAWEANDTKMQLQQDLRKALGWISEDLRQSGTGVISDVPADGTPYSSITFNKVSGVSGGAIVWDTSAVAYSLSGTDLERQVGSQTPTVIAQNVSSLAFQRSSSTPKIVEVSIAAQEQTTRGKSMTGKAYIQASEDFKIYLRN